MLHFVHEQLKYPEMWYAMVSQTVVFMPLLVHQTLFTGTRP